MTTDVAVAGAGDGDGDSSGNVSFAGTNYRVGNKFRRRQVQVAIVDGTVEISVGEELMRVHPIRRDRIRARRTTSPDQRRLTPRRVEHTYRSQPGTRATGP